MKTNYRNKLMGNIMDKKMNILATELAIQKIYIEDYIDYSFPIDTKTSHAKMLFNFSLDMNVLIVIRACLMGSFISYNNAMRLPFIKRRIVAMQNKLKGESDFQVNKSFVFNKKTLSMCKIEEVEKKSNIGCYIMILDIDDFDFTTCDNIKLQAFHRWVKYKDWDNENVDKEFLRMFGADI